MPGTQLAATGRAAALIFPLPSLNLRRVKKFPAFLALLAWICASAQAAEKKPYILYATFLEDTPVELSDGAKWMMDRGDSFPILMFKEQQTVVVLEFAGMKFPAEAGRVKITPGEQVTAEMVANYRKNVRDYIDRKSEKIQRDLRAQKKP